MLVPAYSEDISNTINNASIVVVVLPLIKTILFP